MTHVQGGGNQLDSGIAHGHMTKCKAHMNVHVPQPLPDRSCTDVADPVAVQTQCLERFIVPANMLMPRENNYKNDQVLET